MATKANKKTQGKKKNASNKGAPKRNNKKAKAAAIENTTITQSEANTTTVYVEASTPTTVNPQITDSVTASDNTSTYTINANLDDAPTVETPKSESIDSPTYIVEEPTAYNDESEEKADYKNNVVPQSKDNFGLFIVIAIAIMILAWAIVL